MIELRWVELGKEGRHENTVAARGFKIGAWEDGHYVLQYRECLTIVADGSGAMHREYTDWQDVPIGGVE